MMSRLIPMTACLLVPVNSRRTPTEALRQQRGFSLTELAVVAGIILLLVSLLLPAAGRAYQVALGAQCQSNLRQIGIAMTTYQAEHIGALPKAYDATTTLWWYHSLMSLTPSSDGGPYLTSSKALICPLKKTGAYALLIKPPTIVGYGMLDTMLWYPAAHRQQDEPRMMMKIRNPSDWPLVMDADYPAIYGLDNPTATANRDSRFAARHRNLANVLMADGHVELAAYGDTRWHQKVLNDEAHFSK